MSELLIASSPTELVASQKRLIDEIDAKREAALVEARDAEQMVNDASRARLHVGGVKRIHLRATARVTYLTKVGQALRAGFVMMPDMPGEMVAVRTGRTHPASRQWQRGGGWGVPDERCQSLPAGDGRYVSPRQAITTRRVPDGKNSDGSTRYADESRAIELRDPDGLARRFIRPEVIARTAGAMVTKIFDEIATVSPSATRGPSRGRDPIVLGRIVDNANGRVAAFLIAWFVDSAEL